MKSDALDKAYKRYYKELYYYAVSLCRQEDLAKDLVNETFFKAFMASNIPEVQEEFKYWLFRILKNHYIDLTRKKTEDLTFHHLKTVTPNRSSKEPSENYIKQERNERLLQHLMKLEPDIYREVIYLYYYAELNIKEISESVNRTETNTKTILYRARKKLGKVLKEDSYEF